MLIVTSTAVGYVGLMTLNDLEF